MLLSYSDYVTIKKRVQKSSTPKISHTFLKISEKKKRKIGKIRIDYTIKLLVFFAYAGGNFFKSRKIMGRIL